VGEGEGDVDREVAGLDGAAALPRRNGELVFQAPWEGRAFGMAVALRDRGVYRWDEFRDLLVQRIAEGSPGYYKSWLGAFEDLLLARGMIGPAELSARAQEFKDLRRDPLP
jgi:nitrile hydratase accessory protein